MHRPPLALTLGGGGLGGFAAGQLLDWLQAPAVAACSRAAEYICDAASLPTLDLLRTLGAQPGVVLAAAAGIALSTSVGACCGFALGISVGFALARRAPPLLRSGAAARLEGYRAA